MIRTIHSFQGSPKALLQALTDRYLNTSKNFSPPSYTGLPNDLLDRDFHIYELESALSECKKNSAPGPDQVTYRLLANLDGNSLDNLLHHINTHWSSGRLPPQWKTAEIRFIPKPNKSPHLDNLRPISLTSCVGKLVERLILRRLQPFLEERGLFPNTMYGFRKHLSTHDILLRLKEEVLAPATRHSPRAILALDLKGAFDNVLHSAILSRLNQTGCGHRVYSYISDFLTQRQAILKVGDLTSDPILLGDRGTPQGSVLSPLLFNLALLDLPKQLDAIPKIHHALYADDITIWTDTDSIGNIQDALQEATDIVQSYALSVGLQCTPHKSELIIVRKHPPSRTIEPISLHLDGQDIKPSSSIKILGLTIQANTRNDLTLSKLSKTFTQVTHMLRRISNRHHGLKEQDMIRLIRALLISRVTYVAPYLCLTKGDLDAVDKLIRKAFKQALGLPMNTSTQRLLQLGLHNTVSELIEGHLASQRVRLTQTPAGLDLLKRLRLAHPASPPALLVLPEAWRSAVRVRPIPKNMHPDLHPGRRQARSQAHESIYGNRLDVAYTDASSYPGGQHKVATVTTKSALITCASINTTSTQIAEELAIALALIHTKSAVILTDSQAACRSFLAGRVAPPTVRILSQHQPQRNVALVWTPAHCTLTGNNFAHHQACALSSQAPEEQAESTPLVTFQDITQYYRLDRQQFPQPHSKLSKLEETTLRRIQTNTFVHPIRLHHMFPTQFPAQCTFCSKPGTLVHILLECAHNPDLPPFHSPLPLHELWENLITSDHLDVQQLLASRASVARSSLGFPD